MHLWKTFLTAGALCLLAASPAAAELSQDWVLVNPAGVIATRLVEPAPRITSLEGKTVALRWNGKNNGDIVLDHLAELLTKHYPSVNIVKTYELDENLNHTAGNDGRSEANAKSVASVRPDLVIASQGD